MARPFAPLNPDDHCVGIVCRLCGAPLLVGQEPSLVVDSEATYTPGSEAAERKAAGRPHNAVAAVVHWTCVVRCGLEDR